MRSGTRWWPAGRGPHRPRCCRPDEPSGLPPRAGGRSRADPQPLPARPAAPSTQQPRWTRPHRPGAGFGPKRSCPPLEGHPRPFRCTVHRFEGSRVRLQQRRELWRRCSLSHGQHRQQSNRPPLMLEPRLRVTVPSGQGHPDQRLTQLGSGAARAGVIRLRGRLRHRAGGHLRPRPPQSGGRQHHRSRSSQIVDHLRLVEQRITARSPAAVGRAGTRPAPLPPSPSRRHRRRWRWRH